MGLFGKRKNKEVNRQSVNSNQDEFSRDIQELLNRDDMQCRQDICKAEYEKAQKLLNNPTQETIHRAYDIMGNLAAQFDYVPAVMWMGDFAENAMGNLEQSVFWYKKAAELGDGNGAKYYADMLMTGRGVQQDPQLAMKYYSEAAGKGVPEALFVIGEYHRNNGNREQAMRAYQEAYSRGYAPAMTRINQMKSGQR